MIPEIIIGLIAAAVSSLGFALMFRVRPRHLWVMALGGLLCDAIYLLAKAFTGGEFFPNLAAAILAAFFSEACAHNLRAPVQIYLIPVLVPLIPGGLLYYAMYYLLAMDYSLFTDYLLVTLETALGLSGGIIVGLAVANAFLSVRKRISSQGLTRKP
ncbi:MAG: threonine/serine exporter family protein [Clostridia bacterium]|nr:threonine/serine exporter family protein [Clostridia bacterium]